MTKDKRTHADKGGITSLVTLDIEKVVAHRYSEASKEAEPALCCPVSYDAKYLRVLPEELIERDYGCGDPSRYVREGDTVLDLGSGGGKICYIASQLVGPSGRVIGIDMNDDMLALARGYREEIGKRIGWHNVEFFKGRIQDLGLPLEEWEGWLAGHPIRTSAEWLESQKRAEEWRRDRPLVASESIDVVISNCVLNLVDPADRRSLFGEIYRVLRTGGRIAISDIVCDEPAPERLKNDARLWSGCLSGAYLETEFLEAFAAVGFQGVRLAERAAKPWAVIEGIEFRSVTVEAFKGTEQPELDLHQAVVYRGPWKAVTDDRGRELRRGVRTAVGQHTFRDYTQGPYAGEIIPIEPNAAVPLSQAARFEARTGTVRLPQETKGEGPATTRLPGENCCGPDDCCG